MRLDCFAGWRGAPQVLLFIFSVAFFRRHPPPRKRQPCVRVHALLYPQPSWRYLGGGVGRWRMGHVVRGSEASISYGIQPVQIASMASLTLAPAPANLSISTVSPISLLYSTLLFFCGFLLILRSSDLSCPSPPSSTD